MWQNDVAEYCNICDRCQKANKSTGKRLGNMIKIQEPSRPWEIVRMDWVTGLPPGAFHPQTDGLAEKIIQTLEDMVRRCCSYGLEIKYCDGLTHDWCTLLPALELEYKTSIHASTNQTPAILEKGWNPKLPQDSLRKDFFEIHPTAASFKGMLDKARKYAVRCMEDSFAYAKDKWDKSHTTPDFKVGDLVLVSTTNFNNIKGCKKLNKLLCRTFFY
ncbi:hypothetical protein O181_092196 [Austropuccinia psidii MF-1]|uniref:Integrase zinc-binding domain-containing protein n=1 Tax=Austropuccinia psidii MF-1 TaxID=1389203 RepID=A0A9Q3IZ04_9BASI|nr:hypothetical protein [Austropuccinia psidii MF-1]